MSRENEGRGKKQKRHKTEYKGVRYIEGRRLGAPSQTEKIYYISYYRDGKRIEEKAGRQYSDDMTPARANRLRLKKIDGDQKTNKEVREEKKAAEEAERGRWTIDRLWEEYKEHKGAKVKGLESDENRFKNHIGPALGSKEPREIGPLDVERLKKRLREKNPNVADATVRNVLELLRRLVNFGVDMEHCDPVSLKIKMPKVNNEKTECLTPKQLSRLLKAIDQDEDILAANFMRMALFTGLRRGELFKLKWEHINFDRGFISIVDPKGGPDQKVPLNDMARAVLDSHPRTDSPYVSPGRGGRQRTDINKYVNRIKNRAGLPKDFRPLHGLRHVYASMLASSGKVDMYTLQKLLTHKSPMMTQRYAHLRDETLKKASDLAGELIGEIMNGKDKKTASEKKEDKAT
jgi:integrase